VPAGAGPVGAQTTAPAEHVVRPPLQVPGTTHASPGTQVSQPVALQARPGPQPVPIGSRPVGLQTPAPPPEQSRRPISHASPVSQGAPSTQTLQVPPPPQTPLPPGPQRVPVGASSTTTHTAEPDRQSTRPTVQGLPVLHGSPAGQAGGSQVPVAEQTPPGQGVPGLESASAGQVVDVPLQRSATSQALVAGRHGVPAAAGPLAEQNGVPPMQTVRPAWHDSGAVQSSPSTHTVHPPLRQARPAPQRVPSGSAPTRRQTPAPPPVQSSLPSSHGLPVEHGVPATHEEQVPPPPQTPLPPAPQVVPGGASSYTMHCGVPAPQS
jgi:hypothetical protein